MDYPVSDPGSQLHNGRLTDGDSAQGVDPSIDKSAHMNAVYDELLNLITGMGITPDEAEFNQVLQAINIAAPVSQITFHYVDLNDPDPVPGWLLCDGSNGTPNLTDRFVVCAAGGTREVGDTGGSNTKTSSTGGAHNHSVTVNNRTLSESQMPAHYHQQGFKIKNTNLQFGYTDTGVNEAGYEGSDNNNPNLIHTNTVGGSQAHDHTASSAANGNHAHTVDVRPPYFALAPFIRADYAATLNL